MAKVEEQGKRKKKETKFRDKSLLQNKRKVPGRKSNPSWHRKWTDAKCEFECRQELSIKKVVLGH